MRRAAMMTAAVACAAGALVLAVAQGDARKSTAAQPAATSSPASTQEQVRAGRSLFLEACSSCHGDDARGMPGLAPSLHGAGAAAAHFYLSTGRMPLANPTDEPTRAEPVFSPGGIDALSAFVASLGRGPGIPDVDPARGRINDGLAGFTLHCAGCHQVGAEGGIVTGGVAPALQEATPTQIAEAVRVGPYLMPPFDEKQISDAELDSIVRYVISTRHPDNRGGWGIGHIGPIPEGMVAWLLAGATLVLVARLIGERSPR